MFKSISGINIAIKTPKFWQSINWIAILLSPFACIYFFISQIKFFLQKPKKFKAKIICIGNITTGGSGKTPAAIMVGKMLKKQGYNVAYVCKNYTGSIIAPTQLNLLQHDTEHIIDEAFLLAKIAPTFAGKSRIDSIKKAIDTINPDFIIVDDGLQNNSFYKDISVLVVDSKVLFGNNLIFPSGPLREPLSFALNRGIDYIFIIGDTPNILKKYLDTHNVINISTEFRLLNNAVGKKYIAFAGIAYPGKFFQSLENIIDINIIKKISFADHYCYSDDDLIALINKAKKSSAHLITTEKDFVRIPKQYRKNVEVLYMNMKMTDSSSKFVI